VRPVPAANQKVPGNLDNRCPDVHAFRVGRLLHRLRVRRRDRALARAAEARTRELLDARAVAAANLADDDR
jgi:hypothetical protein